MITYRFSINSIELKGFITKVLNPSMKKLLFNTFKKSRKTFAGHGLGKYTIVQKTSNWLAKQLHPDYVIFNSHKFYLDKHDSIHYSLAEEKFVLHPDISKILTDACGNGNTVIDVGANIGFKTLDYAKCVGQSGKVFAFEPIDENFNLLKKNLTTNNYHNVSCIKKAVADEVKIVVMELSTRIGDHRIIEKNNSKSSTVTVDCITLDSFFDNQLKIDFLKIDAEGFDLHVLQGAKNLIKSNPKIVLQIEFNPYLLHLNDVNPKIFLDYLQSLGFTFLDVENPEKPSSNIDELIKKYDNGIKSNLTDLICIRK